MFDKNYVEEVIINFKLRIGTNRELNMKITRDQISPDCRGRGWSKAMKLKDLMDPVKKYVDEQKRLVLSCEVIDSNKFYSFRLVTFLHLPQ